MTLARGVLYLIGGGGDLQEARNTGRFTAAKYF